MNFKQFANAIVVAVLTLAAFAASSQAGAQTSWRVGEWTIVKQTSQMTDKVSCIAEPDSSPRIAVFADKAYLEVLPGTTSVQLRFGTNPAREGRLLTALERRSLSVEIAGNDFAELVKTQRLRVQIVRRYVPGDDGVQGLDFDGAGIGAAVEAVKKCA